MKSEERRVKNPMEVKSEELYSFERLNLRE